MGVVTERFIGGTTASAKEDRSFVYNDLALGIDNTEMTGYLQRPTFSDFETGITFHVQEDSSVKATLR